MTKWFPKMNLKFLVVMVMLGMVHGWGEEGHKIIAQLAANMLNSNAQNAVQTFLGSYTLQQIAPMADDYDHSSKGRWSEPNHFVNMNKGQTAFNLNEKTSCTTGDKRCVVLAIKNYTNILTRQASNPQQCVVDPYNVEPCALMFLVHFVGDSHQPLHIGWGYDRGGNEVKVKWYGTETNLHEVWDDKIIQRWTTSVDTGVSRLTTYINQHPNEINTYTSNLSVTSWADESFQYVRSTCYNYSSTDLSDNYYNRNLPIVQKRLVASGVRLGTLLNNILGGNKETARKALLNLKF